MAHRARRAFINPELLIAITILSMVLCLVLPLAKHFHWHPLLAIGATVGAYALVVLCINFENIRYDVRARKQKQFRNTSE